jgi:uncharacterized circularly permuted ATP-grasp superfamily protein
MKRHFEAHEIDFRSPHGGEEFRLDVVPRLLTAEEWDEIEAGLRQRARTLAAFVVDAYTEQRIVREGVVPARLIETAEGFEPDLVGAPMPDPPAIVVGFDVVRGPDRVFKVLEDNATTPSGIAYTIAARTAIDSFVPLRPPAERRDPAAAVDSLHEAIRRADSSGGGDPSAALIADGPSSSAWFEHQDLAERLALPLYRPEQLRLRNGRLYGEDEDGGRELQVVYRRTDEGALYDSEGNRTWLAELLLEPVRQGNLVVVSPLGVSVVDDKLSHAYVEEMTRFYLGEEPLIPSLRSFDLTVPEQRAEVLDRLAEMVVKPRLESGGEGVVIGGQAAAAQRERLAKGIEQSPESFIAQETVMLSTHPTFVEGGLESRHIDLRAFAFGDGVMPGGLTRVALERGSLIVNSSQDGGAKDTWVLA